MIEAFVRRFEFVFEFVFQRGMGATEIDHRLRTPDSSIVEWWNRRGRSRFRTGRRGRVGDLGGRDLASVPARERRARRGTIAVVVRVGNSRGGGTDEDNADHGNIQARNEIGGTAR